eukprot:978857_1
MEFGFCLEGVILSSDFFGALGSSYSSSEDSSEATTATTTTAPDGTIPTSGITVSDGFILTNVTENETSFEVECPIDGLTCFELAVPIDCSADYPISTVSSDSELRDVFALYAICDVMCDINIGAAAV